LVGSVFGGRWNEVGTLVAISCAPLVFSGPISVATAGFLYAAGDSSAVLLATLGHTVAWLAISMSLLPVVGIIAVPIGWVVGSAIDAWLLALPVRRRVGVDVFRSVILPSSLGLVAGAVGVGVDLVLGRTFVGGVAGGVVAVALCIALFAMLERLMLLELVRLLRERVRRVSPATVPAQ
jgi:O-antigen/teichoic acid export membrane protein